VKNKAWSPRVEVMLPSRISEKTEGVPYQFSFIRSKNPANRPGFNFRTSMRCFTSKADDCLPHYYRVPYINNSGKFTSNTLYVWRTSGENMLKSLYATVSSQLRRLMFKRKHYNKNHRLSDSIQMAIAKAAALYSISHDDWFMNRFLGATRGKPNWESVHGLIHYCVCRMDDIHRFVYGQLLLQRCWLEFRGRKPRDKSRIDFTPEHAIRMFRNEPITKLLKTKVDFNRLAIVDRNPFGCFRNIKSPSIHASEERLRFARFSGKPLPSLGTFDRT